MALGSSVGIRWVDDQNSSASASPFSSFHATGTSSTPKDREPGREHVYDWSTPATPLPGDPASYLSTFSARSAGQSPDGTPQNRTPMPQARSMHDRLVLSPRRFRMQAHPLPPLRPPSSPTPSRAPRKRRRDENDPGAVSLYPASPQTPLHSASSYPQYFTPHYMLPTPSFVDGPTPRTSGAPTDAYGAPKLPKETTQPSVRKRKRKYYREEDKLSIILDFVYDEMRWNVGQLLAAMFEVRANVHNDDSQWRRVCAFLRGDTTHKPSDIISLWAAHPAGKVTRTCSEYSKLYSTCPRDFESARSVHVALTCFAAQATRKRLSYEAERAIDAKNGLHASRKRRKGESSDQRATIHWADIGATTVPRASAIIRAHQPLLYELLLAVAEREPKISGAGETSTARVYRPAECVVTNAISNLDFSRSNRANLLPIARGLLHFALSAPHDLYAYHSRIGTMPAYGTIYRTLEGLAKQEAETVQAHGSDEDTVGVVVTDNVQNHLVQRDARLGRVNTLNIGMAATYIELPHCPPSALDLGDKQRRIAENARGSLTVSRLLGFIDQGHWEVVGVLGLLRTLANQVPVLATYKGEVSLRYRTRAKKFPLKVEASKIHPLATSGKNETVTTELKDAVVDFLEQTGQSRAKHSGQIRLFCGDGLTYEKFLQAKHYLRFHTDPYESLAIIEAVLAPWHTVWTDIGRIFETYWGSFLSPDPSSLAFSAAKIGRKAPSNLSKPDFDQAMETLTTIHDARILDCFRVHYQTDDIFKYFSELGEKNKVPSFEQLEADAKKVWRAFCTHRAAERALEPVGDMPPEADEHANVLEWKKSVPLASRVWAHTSVSGGGTAEAGAATPVIPAPLAPHVSSPPSNDTAAGSESAPAPTTTTTTKKKKKKKKKDLPEEPFLGDRVLANAINFMHDVIVVREFLYAVAEGDAGRVYEAMKVMLFVFAGTSHSKYTQYLLEFICSLELESSQELRETVLSSLLVNLSGQPGRFTPADLIQEYLNRLLQAIAERKGVEYNNHFVREVVSRNLHHLARLRDDLQEGVGLAQRSGRHSAPRRDREIRALCKEYAQQELHHRSPGRTFVAESENQKPSDFRQGVINLQGGKLAKWIRDSSYMRGTSRPTQACSTDSADCDIPSELFEDASPPLPGPGLSTLCMRDGELIIEAVDIEVETSHILQAISEAADVEAALEEQPEHVCDSEDDTDDLDIL